MTKAEEFFEAYGKLEDEGPELNAVRFFAFFSALLSHQPRLATGRLFFHFIFNDQSTICVTREAMDRCQLDFHMLTYDPQEEFTNDTDH